MSEKNDVPNPTPELDALALDAAALEPQAGQPEPKQQPDIPTDQLLRMLLAPLFGLLAPAWGVTQQEIGQLAEAYGAVVDKYFPNGLTAFGPELAAGMVTIAVIGPRMGKPRKIEPTKPAAPKPAPVQGEPVPERRKVTSTPLSASTVEPANDAKAG